MESWEIALVAANKSPTTVSSYLRGVDLYLRWCKDGGHPQELTRAQVQRYMAELSADGKEPNTIRLRGAALRQFAKRLVEEDELPEDPLIGLKPPKLPTKVVAGLSDDQLRELRGQLQLVVAPLTNDPDQRFPITARNFKYRRNGTIGRI